MIQRLLTQTSIQSQLSYYNEFKNELMGRWLESFLGHEHLRVKRTGDYGGGRIGFRGVTGGLRCHWRDYLATMLRSGPQEYDVRYRVGTADIGWWPQSAQDTEKKATDATGEQPAWAEASASRRSNPYLKKQEPTYRTYKEVIEPRRVARGLMQIREQIAEEWRDDLNIIATEGALLREWFCDRESDSGLCATSRPPAEDLQSAGAAVGDDPDAASQDADEVASNARRERESREAPGILLESFSNATRCWSADSSPFRSHNYDLLQRALTRQASAKTAAILAQDKEGQAKSMTVKWLQDKLEAWHDDFEAPHDRHTAGHFLVELMEQVPSVRMGDDGSVELLDPALVVDEILLQRQLIAGEWVEALEETAQAHSELLRDDLTKQLDAELPQDEEGTEGAIPEGKADPEGDEDCSSP